MVDPKTYHHELTPRIVNMSLFGKPIFPGGASGKEPSCQCRRCKRCEFDSWAGGGHGNPLLYSCLENPIDRGAWRDTVHSVA